MRPWTRIFYVLLVVGACSSQEEAMNRSNAEHTTSGNGSALVVSTDESRAESLSHFVQGFYDWYVPLANSMSAEPAWLVVLQSRRSLLTSELAEALERDYEAQSAAGGEIMGLDADPFVNSQDPCPRYEVGETARRGEQFLVHVHSVCAGNRSEEPEVVAELKSHNGTWIFANFHYPIQRSDLLTVLSNIHGTGQYEAQ
jgi:hypothetical protein